MTDKEIEVIIKPIFTKMYKANFSACEYGIECYKKGMEYQGIKELQIENDNLIKRVKELEKENTDLRDNYEQFKAIAEPEIERLKNDNAELKAKNKWYSEQVCFKECAEVWGNLTKAIELLKKMYYLYFEPCVTHTDLENRDKLFEEVKQFLRETDIDNAIQKANEELNLDKIAEEVEDDLKEGCPDVLCEGCTEEDCTARKLGLIC